MLRSNPPLRLYVAYPYPHLGMYLAFKPLKTIIHCPILWQACQHFFRVKLCGIPSGTRTWAPEPTVGPYPMLIGGYWLALDSRSQAACKVTHWRPNLTQMAVFLLGKEVSTFSCLSWDPNVKKSLQQSCLQFFLVQS